MTQTFSGTWLLTATTRAGFYRDSFDITYSDNADGTYEPAGDGTPYVLTVTGQAWTVDFNATAGPGPELSPYDPYRATRTVPGQGLTVTFTGPPDLYYGGPPWVIFGHHLDLELVSQDPHLAPPWEPAPFQFTITQPVVGIYLPPPGNQDERPH
jgi:hypothetical protein